MKKLTLIIAIVVLAISLPVFAQDFPDVPADHWAYDAIEMLSSEGIIQGYPDGTFGGKRAMTRYEFAEALSKAIPVIKEMVLADLPEVPEDGTVVTNPPIDTSGFATKEELAALQSMVNEFRDEIAALGVDIEALRRDMAAINDRLTIVEDEQKRVVVNAYANVIGKGAVNNEGTSVDKDNNSLGGTNDVLENTQTFMDYGLNIKGRVAEGSFVNAMISAGDYNTAILGEGVDDFTLWTMNLDTSIGLGFLGQSHVVLGRFPFQLTPLTMKFVDPDSYINVDRFDSGDFVLDGARASFNVGPVALTAFAAQFPGVNTVGTLLTPTLQLGANGIGIDQVAGARAVFNVSDFEIGGTYYQGGVGAGQALIGGADLSGSIFGLGLNGEWARSAASDTFQLNGGQFDDNEAWNANLSWATGKLSLGAGYTNVQENYNAPGYWSDYGRAINLTNVEGITANLGYGLSSNLSLMGSAAFLNPDNGATVSGRFANANGVGFTAAGVDKVNTWKAGLKYNLTSANSIDFGYEEVNWEALAGADDTEKYITIGLGHTINPNSSFKLLYEIVEYEVGGVDPYGDGGDSRGGRAAAQVQMKF